MKLLVTGAWKSAKEQLNSLTALGHDVIFMQNESENLPCNANEVEGVIVTGFSFFTI